MVDFIPGRVRIRAAALDPFQGLRGRAYIEARGLSDKAGPMRIIRKGNECDCDLCVHTRLLPAVQALCASHERRTISPSPQPAWNDTENDETLALLDGASIEI